MTSDASPNHVVRHSASVEIRPLRPDDYDDAVALWHAARLTRPWNDPSADLKRAIRGPTSTVLGGFLDGRLVATAMTGHDGHRGWVYYLAVDAKVQGQGLGAQMMAAVEAWLRSKCVTKVQLMVRSTNGAASAFYPRIGYELSDVRVFAKWLTPPAQ